MTAITLLKIQSNMSRQGMLHRAARFERRQNRVGVHRCALENLVPERIREGIQDGGTPASNRWLTDTASAHGRLRIRNVQRSPLHVDRHVQYGRRFVVVEAFGNHLPIMRIEHPLLSDRMANAQDRTAEHLTTQRSGMDHRANISGSEEVHDVVLSGFYIDFN